MSVVGTDQARAGGDYETNEQRSKARRVVIRPGEPTAECGSGGNDREQYQAGGIASMTIHPQDHDRRQPHKSAGIPVVQECEDQMQIDGIEEITDYLAARRREAQQSAEADNRYQQRESGIEKCP